MSKRSQWDFGELFPNTPARTIFSVSEITSKVRTLLERNLGQVWVTGEVTNFRAQSSGHIYFTLKDTEAQMACVLFRGEAIAQREFLGDGRKLIVRGDLTVYQARGQYQLVVNTVEIQGAGALQLAFERLKQKLNAEGLFAPERKRPLPRFPRVIGVVSSPTGAAIRDVIHVIKRRNPGLEIIFAPSAVQGAGAAAEIAQAISLLNQWSGQAVTPLDLILVTRGGGSLEDLWAFNEEIVARAIFQSACPVVSAVGHEIDFTIADFVADFRAATPSAAAELITEGVFSSCRFVQQTLSRMCLLARQAGNRARQKSESAAQRLIRCHPKRIIQQRLQRLDELRVCLGRCVRQDFREKKTALDHWCGRFHRLRPAQILKQRRELLRQELSRLHEQAQHQIKSRRARLESSAARLRLLSPEQVLARGYSITQKVSGEIVRGAGEVKPREELVVRLADGSLEVVVQSRVQRK